MSISTAPESRILEEFRQASLSLLSLSKAERMYRGFEAPVTSFGVQIWKPFCPPLFILFGLNLFLLSSIRLQFAAASRDLSSIGAADGLRTD